MKLPAVVQRGALPVLAAFVGLGWWPVSLIHGLMARPVARGFVAGVVASAALLVLVMMHERGDK